MTSKCCWTKITVALVAKYQTRSKFENVLVIDLPKSKFHRVDPIPENQIKSNLVNIVKKCSAIILLIYENCKYSCICIISLLTWVKLWNKYFFTKNGVSLCGLHPNFWNQVENEYSQDEGTSEKGPVKVQLWYLFNLQRQFYRASRIPRRITKSSVHAAMHNSWLSNIFKYTAEKSAKAPLLPWVSSHYQTFLNHLTFAGLLLRGPIRYCICTRNLVLSCAECIIIAFPRNLCQVTCKNNTKLMLQSQLRFWQESMTPPLRHWKRFSTGQIMQSFQIFRCTKATLNAVVVQRFIQKRGMLLPISNIYTVGWLLEISAESIVKLYFNIHCICGILSSPKIALKMQLYIM